METQDFLYFLNEKFEICKLPLLKITRVGSRYDIKNEYYEVELKEKAILLGYSYNGIFSPPTSESFTPFEQMVYAYHGISLNMIPLAEFRESVSTFSILVNTVYQDLLNPEI